MYILAKFSNKNNEKYYIICNEYNNAIYHKFVLNLNLSQNIELFGICFYDISFY